MIFKTPCLYTPVLAKTPGLFNVLLLRLKCDPNSGNSEAAEIHQNPLKERKKRGNPESKKIREKNGIQQNTEEKKRETKNSATDNQNGQRHEQLGEMEPRKVKLELKHKDLLCRTKCYYPNRYRRHR